MRERGTWEREKMERKSGREICRERGGREAERGGERGSGGREAERGRRGRSSITVKLIHIPICGSLGQQTGSAVRPVECFLSGPPGSLSVGCSLPCDRHRCRQSRPTEASTQASVIDASDAC